MTIKERKAKAAEIIGELPCNTCLVQACCIRLTGGLVPLDESICEIKDQWYTKFWDLVKRKLV